MDTLTAPRPSAALPPRVPGTPGPVAPHGPRVGRALVRQVVALYGLGWTGTATVRADGRWRLATSAGAFVVSPLGGLADERRALEDAAFLAAARTAGIAVPEARRTVDGDVVGRTRTGPVVVHPDPDLVPADDVSPAEVGHVLARLHRVGRADRRALEWWYAEPVTAAGWDDLLADLTRAGAPFAPLLATHRDELVHLGALVQRARMVQTCHRAVGPATLRRDVGGGLWLVGWDRIGPADPSHELAAVVLRTAGADRARAAELVTAYRAAGGHGVIDGPSAFSMAVADHAHAVELAGRRWLAASATPADRHREADRVAALLAGPVRPATITALLT